MRDAVSDYAASDQSATFFSTLLAEAMLACGQVAAASERVVRIKRRIAITPSSRTFPRPEIRIHG